MERKAVLIRFEDALWAEASACAKDEKLSFNQFVEFAVGRAVNRHRWEDITAKRNLARVRGAGEAQKPVQGAKKALPMPSGGRNAPCPCGSGKKWKACCRGGQ
jgi:uncharacterized protein YecA (UPF0149 family)